MKPSPPDSQQLYLGSLEAIGLDVNAHDIRFVEDDWDLQLWVHGDWAGKSGAMGWKFHNSRTFSRLAGWNVIQCRWN